MTIQYSLWWRYRKFKLLYSNYLLIISILPQKQVQSCFPSGGEKIVRCEAANYRYTWQIPHVCPLSRQASGHPWPTSLQIFASKDEWGLNPFVLFSVLLFHSYSQVTYHIMRLQFDCLTFFVDQISCSQSTFCEVNFNVRYLLYEQDRKHFQ